jgi:hypothetical protein
MDYYAGVGLNGGAGDHESGIDDGRQAHKTTQRFA